MGAGSSLARFRLRVQNRKIENFHLGLPFFLFLTRWNYYISMHEDFEKESSILFTLKQDIYWQL
jgi:hypothetical protein